MLQFLSVKVQILFVFVIFAVMAYLYNGFAILINIKTTDWNLISVSFNLTILSIIAIKKTRLFLSLWHVKYIGEKLSRWIGVDLHGSYLAVFESNSPLLKKDPNNTSNALSAPSAPRPVYIQVTWEKIIINMENGDKPSESASNSSPVKIKKDENGKITLEYLYQAEVPNPATTDERYYDGAAKLTYQANDGSLTGLYWTNRCYHKGDNTAGRITLTKCA